jgi:hypothetical protein
MKKCWNGIKGLFNNFKSSFLYYHLGSNTFKLLAISSMLLVLLVVGWLLYPDMANSGHYHDSAHGNATDGVNRSSIATLGYSKGNCTHCHEQHASIGGEEPAPTGTIAPYELFYIYSADPYAQTYFFCEACHMHPSPIQSSMPQEYNYSRIAGGDNNACPTSIRMAFEFINDNCIDSRAGVCVSSSGSAHCLRDIVTFLATVAPSSWNFTAGINPCSGCHNPHRAQRDWPISRPSQHNADNNEWGLWGDNISDDPPYNPANERMSNYAASVGATYCAPYRYNSNTTREPDGCPAPQTDCSTDCANGSNLINYVSFCTDCHNATNIIWSTKLRRNLSTIDWSASGDIHGAAAPQTCCDKGDKKPPYTEGTNYVLSCLDCHEPHGSQNEYLLRQEVNNSQVPIITVTGLWYYFCRSCHTNLDTPSQKHSYGISAVEPDTSCLACHRHGIDDYLPPSFCTNCGAHIKTF